MKEIAGICIMTTCARRQCHYVLISYTTSSCDSSWSRLQVCCERYPTADKPYKCCYGSFCCQTAFFANWNTQIGTSERSFLWNNVIWRFYSLHEHFRYKHLGDLLSMQPSTSINTLIYLIISVVNDVNFIYSILNRL